MFRTCRILNSGKTVIKTTPSGMPHLGPVLPPQKLPMVSLPKIDAKMNLNEKMVDFSDEFIKLKLLPSRVQESYDMFKQNGMIVRRDFGALVEKLMNNESKLLDILMDGTQGVGKSALLAQLVNFFYSSNNWIVAYIPNARDWTSGKYPYEPSTPYDGKTASTLFIQVELSRDFIANFMKLNSVLLKNVKCQMSSFATLFDLCQESQKPENLQKCDSMMNSLLQELALQSQYPVFMAIDEANMFHMDSYYKDQDSNRVKANQLSAVRSILQFREHCLNGSNRNVVIQTARKDSAHEFSTSNTLRILGFYLRILGREEALRDSDYAKTLMDNLLAYDEMIKATVEDFRVIENNFLGEVNETIDKYDELKRTISERLDTLYEPTEFDQLKQKKLEALFARVFARSCVFNKIPDSIDTYKPEEVNATLSELAPMDVLETEELLKFYKTKGLIYTEKVSGIYTQKKHFISSGVPGRLQRAVALDNLWDY